MFVLTSVVVLGATLIGLVNNKRGLIPAYVAIVMAWLLAPESFVVLVVAAVGYGAVWYFDAKRRPIGKEDVCPKCGRPYED